MGETIAQIDSFTGRRFAGNPAGVCLLKRPRRDSWMQLVAREMNLPETAFLMRRRDGYKLRWFTPTMEVDLCGHATLASAHWLWEEGRLGANKPACFHTRSGLLTARKQGKWIEMDFPATPAKRVAASEALEATLGVRIRSLGRTRFDYVVEVASEKEVREFQPNLRAVGRLKARGVIVTSRASHSGYDYVSRFFAPACGIDEDPVTGSAHCCLGPYWRERLGRDNLVGYQASARGGIVRTRCKKDRVWLSGQAVTVFRGELV